MIGQKYGRLTIWAHFDTVKKGRRFICVCECGNFVRTVYYRLKSGETQSCGCRNRDINRAALTKHGMYRKPEYHTWQSILKRIDYVLDANYPEYGGRGIKICDRWREFPNFYADMGPRPKGTTIDRIDVNGHYEPGNCRWADAVTQNNNQRGKKTYLIDGQWLTVAQASRHWGVERHKARRRVIGLEYKLIGVENEQQ